MKGIINPTSNLKNHPAFPGNAMELQDLKNLKPKVEGFVGGELKTDT